MVRSIKVAAWLPALLPLLLSAFSVEAALRPGTQHKLDSSKAKSGVIPGAYFVKFKDQGTGKKGKDRTSSVDDSVHTAFEKFLSDKQVNYTPRLKFKSADLVSGMSVNLHSDDAHAVLSSFEGADAVFPLHYMSTDQARTRAIHFGTRDASAASPKANQVQVPLLQSFAPHTLAGIDKVHAAGIYGQGTVVGVLDSGVDYSHHALNGNKPDGTSCFGTGCPVVDGVSFFDQSGNATINEDPFPYCDPAAGSDFLHGTHVAGIIIANDTERGFTGGAPQAQLKMYRVLDCDANGSEDVIASAFQRAYFDNVDVISVSLSLASGWRDTLVDQVVTKINENGVPTVTSAGNVGDAGIFYAKAPAEALGNHASASLQNPDLLGFTATATGNQTFTYLSSKPVYLPSTPSLPVYAYTGNGTDLISTCDPLTDNTPNLDGYVVLTLVPDDCDTDTAVANLQANNATVALMVITPDTLLPYVDSATYAPLQAISVSGDVGSQLAAAVQTGNVTIDFSNPQLGVIPDPTGGYVSFYSNYGPDWELNNYIGTAAVGGNVLSTFPLSLGGYGIISGTSMSTPLTASAYALYKSAKGKKESPAELRSIFMTTAVPVKYNTTTDVLDTVARQGGGQLRVDRAIASTTRVFPDNHALNDTVRFNGTQTFTVTNVGSKAQQFTFSHLPAGTVYGCNGTYTMLYKSGPLDPVNEAQAGASYDPASATVAPGESATVTVTFTQPTPAPNPMLCAIYSGYTQIQSDDENGSLTIPYLGYAGDMHDLPMILYYDDPKMPDVMDPNTNVTIQDGTVFTLNDSDPLQQPVVNYGLAHGSRLTTVDLVMANVTASAARRHLSHKRGHRRDASGAAPATTVPADAIVANLHTDTNEGRTYSEPGTVTITSTYTDMQNTTYTIPDGDYRVLLRVLKLRGDAHNEADFESWLSPSFTVKKA